MCVSHFPMIIRKTLNLEIVRVHQAVQEWMSGALRITLLYIYIWLNTSNESPSTVLPSKSDSDVIFCLQLLSKTLTFTLHLS